MLCGRRGDGLLGELVGRGDAFFYPGESRSQISWRSFAAPWIANDIHDSLKTMTEADATALFFSAPPGTFARFNGSPFYITKIPDLIGMKDRKYIDHTATHQQRGPADIMRYAGLVSCCDTADFGSHRMLTDAQRRILYKLPGRACVRARAISLLAGTAGEPESRRCTRGRRQARLRSRTLRDLPHGAALHQQQAHAGGRFHAASQPSAGQRHHVGFGGHRSRARAQDP